MVKDAVGGDENGIEASQVPVVDESTKHTPSLHARAHRDHHQQHQASEPLDAVSIDDGSSIFATDTMDSRGEMCHHFRAGLHTWIDKFMLTVALVAWFSIGILAIVTSKVLIGDWRCPPLVLTVQQMVCSSLILRMVAVARDGAVQPWPWEQHRHIPATEQTEIMTDKLKRLLPWLSHPNFILVGIFFSLDFLCSNTAFAQSAAHFVETIKASDPITTTAVALMFRVDTLGSMEGASLFLLVTGVLLSTWGNSSEDENDSGDSMADSFKTAATVTTANICFAFRAMNQKRYRTITNEAQQLDDINLFSRMCQVGATFLLVPLCVIHWDDFTEAWHQPSEYQWTYTGLALVNAFSYVTYNLASTYVLSKLTVLHHSSLNCLRRMVAILATSLFFNKSMSFEAAMGLVTSFIGFSSFTYHRAKRQQEPPKAKDSNV